ncbi:6886_t:CDS:2 [Acaulospora morrowiae]|uniref:6886_t:CDS:1 n=1 Tax=Acaulospora morrowiae TaxID=94023 RepID=A0A9N9D9E2_9GLOM|nr:6886_t:CDS:2 [Acaulospora morrowiae]
MNIAKAKAGSQKINCHLEPGFLGPSMCANKLLKKIGGEINRKITPEDKNRKFFGEMTTNPLGLAKNDPKTPNYILLGNNWFYGRKYINDELQIYLPKIVTDAGNARVRATLRVKSLSKSGVTKIKKKSRSTYHKLKLNKQALENDKNNLINERDRLKAMLEEVKLNHRDKYQQKINELEKKVSDLKAPLTAIYKLAKVSETFDNDYGAGASSEFLFQ